MAATTTNLQQDIPVVTVETPRRRDEVLPEHAVRWPATELAEALIREHYDGTSSTSHAIGLELHNAAGVTYPGWRIEQIAQSLGLADEKRDELVERVRRQEAQRKLRQDSPAAPRHAPVRDIHDAIAVVSNGAQTPTRALLREDLVTIAEERRTVCAQCGRRFDAWRRYKGRTVATAKCHECWRASRKWSGGTSLSAESVESAEPDEPLASDQTPRPGWVDVLPEPSQRVVASQPTDKPTDQARISTPVILDCPLDVPLDGFADLGSAEPQTFADLPESELVFGLLDLLPVTKVWTSRRRRRWLEVFTGLLDLLIEEVDG